MSSPWTVRIYKDALEAIYRLQRGEAVKVRDIIYHLSLNPFPDDAEPLSNHMTVYRVSRDGYQIIFEGLEQERALRILNVTLLP